MQEVPNRIIARLDIKNDYVVKGLMMEGVQRVGNPIELAQKYYAQGADEILIWIPQASVAIGSFIFFICVFHHLVFSILNKKINY